MSKISKWSSTGDYSWQNDITGHEVEVKEGMEGATYGEAGEGMYVIVYNSPTEHSMIKTDNQLPIISQTRDDASREAVDWMQNHPLGGAYDHLEDWKRQSVIDMNKHFAKPIRVDKEKLNYDRVSSRIGFMAVASDESRGSMTESEWIVAKDYESADRIAKADLKRMYKQDPVTISEDLKERFAYVGTTDKRMIAQDDARARTVDLDKEELLRMAGNRGADVSEDDDIDTIREEVRITLSDQFEADIEDDPKQYFERIYGDEWVEQSFVRIDYDEMADYVVSHDGAGRTLDIVDGAGEELDHGAIAYARN